MTYRTHALALVAGFLCGALAMLLVLFWESTRMDMERLEQGNGERR